jgi:hypothetical protein
VKPKLVGWTGFLGFVVFLIISLFIMNSKTKETCMNAYQNDMLHQMLALDVDKDKYCGCVASKASMASNVDKNSFMVCFSDHIHAPFMRSCNNDLNPQLSQGTGLTLDCDCLYKLVSKSSWDLFSNPNLVITKQNADKFNLKIVLECSNLE